MSVQCSDHAHDTLWREFHKNPFDTLYMPRKEYDEVMACHGREPPGILVKQPAPTAKHYQVHREPFFNWLSGHGAICGKPRDDD